MPFFLYTVTAAALVWLAHRFVRPLSRWTMLILFLLPFTFFGYALVTSRVAAPIDLPYQTVPLNWMKAEQGIEEVSPGFLSDVYSQFVPWRQALRWSLAHGEWGLRNPFALSGDVLLGGHQAAVFSPFTLIALLMPAALSFTYTATVTLLVAALCMFLLARELGCGEAAALIAAAGWSHATAILVFVMMPMSATWAWAPLLLAAVHRVIAAPGTRSGVLLTFVFTALLYSSHPESTALAVLLGLFYAAFHLRSWRPIPIAVAAGVVALLLSAIHLLPLFEALPQSMEHAFRASMPAPQPAKETELLARVASSFVPYLHGRRWAADFEWFDSSAVGSVVVALAIFGVIRVRTRTSWFFAGLALFCLLAHAKWPPLVAVLQKVPVLQLALTDRLSFGFALCLCVLAALGVEALNRRAAWVMGGLLVVLGLANWWAVHTPLVAHDVRRYGPFAIAAELLALVAGIAIVLWRPRATALLLGLVIAQRAITEHGLYKSFDQQQAYPPIPILNAIDRTKGPFRIVGHGNALLPQTATMYGLEDVRGYTPVTLNRYFETYPLWCVHQPVFYNRVDDLTRPFLSFLNVRYAITWDRDPPPPGWREVARQKGSLLLENLNARDRAFTYGSGAVTIRDARLGYDIDAQMQNDGWVFTSIPAWKGWRASIDGHRVKTALVNHAFLAVRVPRGAHNVTLRYRPESFVWGRAITAATLVAAAIGLWLLKRRKLPLDRLDPSVAALPLGQ